MGGQNTCQRIHHFVFRLGMPVISSRTNILEFIFVSPPLHKSVQFRCTFALFGASPEASGSFGPPANSLRLVLIV